MSAAHGYVAYTYGCRCEVCRAAKADYMRARRAQARTVTYAIPGANATSQRPTNGSAFSPGAVRFVASIPRHGTRYGYEEKGCRCRACTSARTTADARYYAKRATP